MALVRISRDLQDSVEQEITALANKIYNEQVATLCPEAATSEVTDPEFATLCENMLWGDYVHLKDNMPDRWCVSPGRIDAHFKMGGQQLMLRVTRAGGKLKCPPTTSMYGPDVYLDDTHMDRIPWVRTFLQRSGVFAEAEKAHIDKFAGIKAQVRAFLYSCKSLNDAVKKWPDIKLWVPQRFLTELDRVVERTPRAKKEADEAKAAIADIDTSLITSLGVMKAIQSS